MGNPKDEDLSGATEPVAPATERTGRLAELGLMTATLAHEQRQPLFAIKSLAQLLVQRADPGSRALLDQLLGQVMLLERIVDGVVLYARNPSEIAVPVDPGRVVQGAVELMSHQARVARVTLVAEVEAGVGAARGDPTALTQVVVNLVRNALDASPVGAQVQVVVRTAGDGVEILVQDDGDGVPPVLRERIFEPFFTTKGPEKGTGLGLSISRRIVESYGGQIDLPACERGCTVRVRLSAWRGALDATPART